ncbi:MAG: DinB family protein [Cyclobacteriaceae bacterium]|nr:DinB family protein [Cyclobacteriaceae bacterium HetDA_MAG_MS6]
MIIVEQLIAHLNQNGNLIIENWGDLDEDTKCFKPNAKSWSIVEIVQHLNLTIELYLPNIRKALEGLEKTDAIVEKDRTSFVGKFAINGQKPKDGKRKMKMKTFKFFDPERSEYDPALVFTRFEVLRGELIDLIKQARQMNVGKAKVVSAIGPLLKFRVMECFAFLMAHEDRHIQQGREVLKQLQANTAH